LFAQGTVLIAIVGATIGNTGILVFDSCCPDSLVALTPNAGIQSRFVEYYLRQQKLRLRDQSYASGGQPNINLQTLKPLHIPFPPPKNNKKLSAVSKPSSTLPTPSPSARPLSN